MGNCRLGEKNNNSSEQVADNASEDLVTQLTEAYVHAVWEAGFETDTHLSCESTTA